MARAATACVSGSERTSRMVRRITAYRTSSGQQSQVEGPGGERRSGQVRMTHRQIQNKTNNVYRYESPMTQLWIVFIEMELDLQMDFTFLARLAGTLEFDALQSSDRISP